MATEDAHSTLVTEINSILSDLQNTNKAKRRKALERLHHLAFETETYQNQETQDKILDFSLKHLVTCLADQSEVNRTKSSEILLTFSQRGVVKQGQLVHVIPALHHRLATVPQVEESEDVRLVQVNIISSLTAQFQGAMVPYMNDIVAVLKEAVVDVSPEVRKAAAECVSCFAKATREKFHMQSMSLAKPLVKALLHQRFRNRVAAVTALGTVLPLLYWYLNCMPPPSHLEQ